ncbi:MAG: AAA family ATPase, partial [Bacteroidales bacterium]|nr:AAA family ATPase [Bacteroidales bacterium]
MDKIYLGLTGRMASGKGEVVKILEGNEFKYISLSDIVREEAQKTGNPVSRAEMQNIGNRLRQQEGPGALAKRVRQKIRQSSQRRW